MSYNALSGHFFNLTLLLLTYFGFRFLRGILGFQCEEMCVSLHLFVSIVFSLALFWSGCLFLFRSHVFVFISFCSEMPIWFLMREEERVRNLVGRELERIWESLEEGKL